MSPLHLEMRAMLCAFVLICAFTIGTAAVCYDGCPDHLAHHSVYPPMLQNYWDAGIHFWSFGSAVVFSDNYIRIVPRTTSVHGYLWNKYPSSLDSWMLNVTVRALMNAGTNENEFSGMGLWYVAEPSRFDVPTFYGIPKVFDGIGVVLDAHQRGMLHLVTNGGTPVDSLESVSRGSCKVNLAQPFTVLLEYSQPQGMLTLRVISGGYQVPEPCSSFPLDGIGKRFYFGVTAINTLDSMSQFDVMRFFVSPASGEKPDPKVAENEERQEFNVKKEADDKAYWSQNGDKEPVGTRHQS